jgi:hypothetical protein
MAWSATEKAGYLVRNAAATSPLSMRVRIWSNECAPSGVHYMDCFLAKRLASSEFTSDSMNAVKCEDDVFPTSAAGHQSAPLLYEHHGTSSSLNANLHSCGIGPDLPKGNRY